MHNLFLKNFFAYPVVIFSLIIYLYFLKINFLPYYLIIPYLVLGVCVFFFETFHFGLRRRYLFYFILVILSFLWALFSYAYNIYSDFFYIKETLLLSLIYFFSAFGIKQVFHLCGFVFDFENVLKFSIFAVFFQLLISLFANLFPSILSLFVIIFNIDGLSLDAANTFMEARFIGIGAAFFASGIITSFFLILLSYYINTYCKNANYFFYVAIYLFFIVIGILFSRTTLVGVLLSIIFFVNVKNIIKIILFAFPILILSFLLVKNLISSNEKISFGFDFLFNFKKSQASSSVGELAEMYSILPKNIDTWILGDSKYKNLINGSFSGYYKDTDVGYFRAIFANGIVGLILFICINAYVLLKSFSNKFLFLFLFLCLLILNTKGIAHIFFFSFLFFIINNSNQLNLRENDV